MKISIPEVISLDKDSKECRDELPSQREVTFIISYIEVVRLFHELENDEKVLKSTRLFLIPNWRMLKSLKNAENA